MRSALVLLACVLALAAVPAATADVAVRTCDTPTFCHDVVSVPAPVTCNVDVLKNGLGRPPGVRLSGCA